VARLQSRYHSFAETDISDIASSIADGAESWLKLQNRVSEFTLPNGLHFIVLERHNAPVLSCHTYANVGAFDEEDGRTGGHAAKNVIVSASAMTVTNLPRSLAAACAGHSADCSAAGTHLVLADRGQMDASFCRTPDMRAPNVWIVHTPSRSAPSAAFKQPEGT